jgi:hypothetical protein
MNSDVSNIVYPQINHLLFSRKIKEKENWTIDNLSVIRYSVISFCYYSKY